MALIDVGELPEAPLAAAALFHGEVLPKILVFHAPLHAGEELVLVFAPADHTHQGWRLAAVQSLARQFAPARINAIASDDPAAIAAAQGYLANAPGVTGQLLPLDSIGAEAVIGSAA